MPDHRIEPARVLGTWSGVQRFYNPLIYSNSPVVDHEIHGYIEHLETDYSL